MNEKTKYQILIFALLYFLVARPVLIKLGVVKSKIAKDIENEIQSNSSPFNNDYWRKFYASGNTSANGRKPLTKTMIDKAKINANILYNAFGYFLDNEDIITNVFKVCKNKSEVSLLAFYFEKEWGKNILVYLKNGKDLSPQNGLNDSEIAKIFNYVKALPE